MSQETTPLLDNCCSEQEGCCRYNKNITTPNKNPVIPTSSTALLIPNEEHEDPSCQLSNQPWKYKMVAFFCALSLAGNIYKVKKRHIFLI